MATSLTPEQSARKILSIFVKEFNVGSGGVLLTNNLQAVCNNHNLSHQDLILGMDFAIAKVWVEVLEGGNSYKLTDAGFNEA